MSKIQWLQVALRFVLSWAGSVAIGFAFFGERIFQNELAVFQFVTTGAIAGLAVAVAPLNRRNWMLGILIVGFLAVVGITRSNEPALLLRDAVMVVAIIVAVLFSLRLCRAFPRVSFGKFVFWGAAFALLHIVAVGLLNVVLRAPSDGQAILFAARVGALIGLGVGLGYEVSELASRRLGEERMNAA